MKHFLLGVLATLVMIPLLGLVVASSGVVDVSAVRDGNGSALESLLGYASRRSIAHHAVEASNPFQDDNSALARGLEHFKANCLDCHGAPALPRSEFAKGLNPSPPTLTTDAIQAKSDGELFWVMANGIRMTGMPAFSPTHNHDEIWKIVAFVRHLGSLTEKESEQLGAGRAEDSEHHDHHEEADHH